MGTAWQPRVPPPSQPRRHVGGTVRYLFINFNNEAMGFEDQSDSAVQAFGWF